MTKLTFLSKVSALQAAERPNKGSAGASGTASNEVGIGGDMCAVMEARRSLDEDILRKRRWVR